MSSAVVLFTRDLRLRDQPALAAAVREHDRVVPAFVLDDQLLEGAAPNRRAFLLDSLRDLDAALRERGGKLVLRHGDPVEEALRLARECHAEAVHLSADVSAYAHARTSRLAAACEHERIALRVHAGVTAVAPAEVLPAGGDHYRVFTPYWRAWRLLARSRPLPSPRRVVVPAGLAAGTRLLARRGAFPGSGALSDYTAIAGNGARAGRSPELPAGGESAGRERLNRWVAAGLADYERLHDDLAADATSRLSPYLHFGCLSVGDVLARVEGRPGGDAFARQLCWRDFYHQVLAARPGFAHTDYRPRERRWSSSKRLLDAWKQGRTGYPIVDAGMRQLEREGFMHNRARMIVASFLTKLMRIDWRQGAAHFWELLLDGDLANNAGNWQWVAGTGNDTRPNRVLSPLRQARRFDPDGDYVRRYVPELASVAGRAVHEPWRLSVLSRRQLDYPKPVIDADAATAEFRRRVAETAQRPAKAKR